MKKSFYLSGLLVFCFVLFAAVVEAAVPTITTNPASTTVCSGSQAKFIFAATGTAPITFSWLVSSDGGTTWSLVGAVAPYSGNTNDTLKVLTTHALNGYKYKGIATNTSGADTSTAATLGVDTSYSVITGPSALCIGQTITLSDATTGGTWVSVHTDSATVNATTGVVTGVGAGKDTILYIVTNTCGTDTAKKAITINPIPSAGTITGASIVCKNASITLSDGTSGGTWSSITPAIATVGSTGVVTGVAQGTATIDYTVSNGSCAVSTSFAVRVDTVVTPLPITGPTATCIGGTINLMNANVTGIGVWSTSNGNATVSSAGVVTGFSAGTDIITYLFTNACNSVTTTVSEEIDAPLNHGAISGPSNVCKGSAITLTETVGSGIWLSSDPAIANVNSSGDVTGVSQGTAVISYYLSNACGASIATYTVTVSRPATTITGGDSVGVGLTLALSDTVSGGVWSSANSGIAHIDAVSGVVTGVAAGTTTITYTVTDVCGTSSAILTVYVGVTASANIVGLDSVCVGNTITLSNSVAGGVWSVTNPRASISGIGVVTGVSKGLDTVYYTVTNGFGTSQMRKIIYVNHLPVITLYGPNIISLGGNYFIYGYPQGGTFSMVGTTLGEFIGVFNTTYVLDSVLHPGKDSTTINVTAFSFVDTSYGTSIISYHLSNGCGTTDSTFTLSLHPLGVSTLGNNTASLHVFPNPNQGEFNVNLSSGITEDAIVTVTNIVGEKVKVFTIPTNQSIRINLDQPAGMYFLSASTSTGRYSTKITISK